MKLFNKLIYQWIEQRFMDGCSDYNTLEVRKKTRSKQQARQLFVEHDIPHARGTIFTNPLKAYNFVKKHGFPVVIKPNVSGYSRGSHFPITNFREFWKAVFLVKIWWPSSIIEEYLEGKNYRVVVIKDEIMSVIRRYPPFVVGDGKTTIADLIDMENVQRQKMDLLPVIHTISKNSHARRFLRKQQLSLASVPKQGKKIYLHNKIALAPGGVVETIDKDTVSPENRKLFLKILDSFNANIFGIDVIFEKGIEFDPDQQKCIFLELNSRPYLKMHHFPRYGKKPELDSYFTKLNSIELSDAGVF
ncbi:MAG: cyanophycin synthetase [Deltaproteobacteria bacterium]|jgi:D-alanine-D-alanine ligase-like ATP-grasp enzyme|nr:cyanophycin synthetase [Deltaproteobacteria bacterium]MBT4642908.1 cyanophycin synthetase [Deltaproteobacteria bacterium]MBT6501148.1 cyanophycin synthetase [Deltaproteobacteria bacterium]MBT6613076.1 cyanophycin synthetase [Deltaproteobacteria bacterium]MBT7150854.1 cyanophycin synthetase [Deltaproteobacteria bacterium]